MVDAKEMPIISLRMMLAIQSVSKECTVQVVQKQMGNRKYHLPPLQLPCHQEYTLPIV